jgi:uncharacterized protein (DUF1330 family)
MTTKSTVLAVFAGLVIGALAIKGLQAQAPSPNKGPAFYIAEYEVIDREGLKPYSARVSSTLEPFGGRFIVRGGKIAPLEGETPKGIVVISFESIGRSGRYVIRRRSRGPTFWKAPRISPCRGRSIDMASMINQKDLNERI